jgi:hypothetical protein
MRRRPFEASVLFRNLRREVLLRRPQGPRTIRHVGRKSGRSYETPVILVALPEGFIAELT